MKQKDIKPCTKCGKGVMNTGLPLFWKVTLERFGINGHAVKRQAGLEMMLGNAALARVMGPDEDIAIPVMDAKEIILCEGCAEDIYPIFALVESE